MHHSYQLIDTNTAGGYASASRILGELNAAKSWLAQCRTEAKSAGELKYRMAVKGDDPIDVYADNALVDLRLNAAVETVLRAEGILACAQRRFDDWKERDDQKRTSRTGIDWAEGVDADD